MKKVSKIAVLLFYAAPKEEFKISYNEDWREAFLEHPSLEVDAYNLKEKRWLVMLPWMRQYELIIFLHSTNSNNIAFDSSTVGPFLQSVLKFRKGKIVFFVGNEYKLIPEKIALIKKLQANYIVSQLPQDVAEWLYQECPISRTISLPHALNPKVFRCRTPHQKRFLDIGARAAEYPWYLGDKERAELFQVFGNGIAKDLKLKIDVSLNWQKRFNRQQWADFLNNCKGTVSTEAGTSFLERDDHTRKKVNEYLQKKPEATFEEVFQLFFANYPNPVSGKCIASRHFDAIGTKTCQIMFPGRFNDILKADEHYIALNRDFSNIDNVLERFLDDTYRQKMVDRTYEYAMDCHTHQYRIDQLLSKIF